MPEYTAIIERTITEVHLIQASDLEEARETADGILDQLDDPTWPTDPSALPMHREELEAELREVTKYEETT